MPNPPLGAACRLDNVLPRCAMFLTTDLYAPRTLEALAADLSVAAALLDIRARTDPDPQLPPQWHLEDVTAELVANARSTDPALQVVGVVVAD